MSANTNTQEMCADVMRHCKELENDIRFIQEQILPKGHSFNLFLEEAFRKIRLVDNMAYYVANEAAGAK